MKKNTNLSAKNKSNESKILVGVLIFAIVVLVIFIIVITFLILLRQHSSLVFYDPYEKFIDEKTSVENIRYQYSDDPEYYEKTIFVSISSYRDPELCRTLEDIFRTAYNPKRLVIGICEQTDEKDDPFCFSETYFNQKSNFNYQNIFGHDIKTIIQNNPNICKKISMHYSKARGPTFARSLCEDLFDNEDYYLLIDSHMRLEPGFDCELIDNILRSPRPKRTVITIYPHGFERKEQIKNGKLDIYYPPITERMTQRVQRISEVNDEGIVRFESYRVDKYIPLIPEYTGFFAGCFAFSVGEFVKQIPYPKGTDYMFFGEEMFMSIRAFTNGWDLRAPRFGVLYHNWSRSYRKTHMNTENIRLKSLKKARRVIYGKDNVVEKDNDGPALRENELLPDDIGMVRSRQDYFDYIGIHLDEDIVKHSNKFSFLRNKKNWTLPKNFKDIDDKFCEKTKYNTKSKLIKKRISHIFGF